MKSMMFFPPLPNPNTLKTFLLSNVPPLQTVETTSLLITYNSSQLLSLYCAFQHEDDVYKSHSHHLWRACQVLCTMTYTLHIVVN